MVRNTTQPINGVDLLTQYSVTGSPAVFEQIMRAYGGMVFSVCVKVTKDPADAEDASQAVFLTLAVQCKTGATIRYLGPWLKKVAKRTSLDLVRSRKRRTRREQVTAENRPEYDSAHPGAKSEHGELSAIIRAELDQLPSKYRMPLVLHYFGGLSHDEISAEMKCTTAALGVRLHRARKMLGKRLSERGVSLNGAALSTALVASVHHCISDRFVRQTTDAMIAMGSGVGGPLMRMSLPAGLGNVPLLMAEVAQSMARARIKWATAALVASVTMLGGAAEAVRHLPDAIRPNLEFLAPSRALDNLFRSFTPTPRVSNEPSATRSQVASNTAPIIPPLEPVPSPLAMAALPSAPAAAPASQRIYSFQVPTTPPPISTHLPKIPPVPQPVRQATASTERLATPSEPPPLVVRPTPAPVPVATGGHYDNDSGEKAIDPAPALPPVDSSSPRPPDSAPLPQYVVKPAQETPQTAAPPHSLNAVGAINFSAVGGQDLALATTTGPNLVVSKGDTNSGNLVSYLHGANLSLYSGDVYVNGDRIYHWGDTDGNISNDNINSIDFRLKGSKTDGIVSISRLPTNSTLVPGRPDGHTFIGLWKFDSTAEFARVAIKVRYDELLAESLGLNESILKLWVYDGSKWMRINDASFQRDLANHTLYGEWTKFGYIGVSAPDPASTLGIVGLAAGWLLRRRRRA